MPVSDSLIVGGETGRGGRGGRSSAGGDRENRKKIPDPIPAPVPDPGQSPKWPIHTYIMRVMI